ncbi:MAG: D-alanine--D-alanine ligase family protein, partial [Gammaproteobacteria bacterium]|nr:D-alanine--D-alanine ligase family protein [Gammaproteobacteria bacterium]
MNSDRRMRVGVLFGGRSPEHEVSVQSARSVLAAIDTRKYEVVAIGVTKGGEWLVADAARLAAPARTAADGEPVCLLPHPARDALVPLGDKSGTARATHLDVIIPLIHGPLGEDGTVQGLLELADVPYVGAGVLGSALGMDKVAMKAMFRHRGLPVTPYVAVTRARWRAEPAAVRGECETELELPWFVKPANMGSSVGVAKVADAADLARAMDAAARYDRKLLVEQAVPGAREIEVSVLGNDDPQASVPGEIIPCHDFYDYEAKYVDDATRLVVPADVPAALAERLRELSREAFRALDCAGLARGAFLVRGRDLEVFVSELNTLPGFTPVSMYPRLWEASGLPYP